MKRIIIYLSVVLLSIAFLYGQIPIAYTKRVNIEKDTTIHFKYISVDSIKLSVVSKKVGLYLPKLVRKDTQLLIYEGYIPNNQEWVPKRDVNVYYQDCMSDGFLKSILVLPSSYLHFQYYTLPNDYLSQYKNLLIKEDAIKIRDTFLVSHIHKYYDLISIVKIKSDKLPKTEVESCSTLFISSENKEIELTNAYRNAYQLIGILYDKGYYPERNSRPHFYYLSEKDITIIRQYQRENKLNEGNLSEETLLSLGVNCLLIQ